MSLHSGQRLHFVGIGGFGLSAIARILLQRGFVISGSDKNANDFTRQLANEGATIYQGHSAEYVAGAEALVISSAVPKTHIEVAEAEHQGIPVYKRSDILSALMQDKQCLAIAGTHGKTTTTAMVVHILRQCHQHPSYIVGGVMANTGDNASNGQGTAFVIEADEYDNMFHGLVPHTAVVTSLEYDHPDFFATEQTMHESFAHFAGLVRPEGHLILCADNASLTLASAAHAPITTYGFSSDADWHIHDVRYQGDTMQFTVSHLGESQGQVVLHLYGKHNALNATAALIIAHEQGIPFAQASAALTSFGGTGRRFDVRSDVAEIAVIDDYAHHPTAILTTIDAARHRYPEREIWAVWQPHTFSRTQQLLEEYAQAFGDAHHVMITDIFPSREAFTDAIHSRDVLAKMTHPHAQYTGSFENTVACLVQAVRSPAVILIMSAGDAPKIGLDYINKVQS